MISRCLFRGAELRFHDGRITRGSNVFTIVVGRNGAGKSRLLRDLVNEFADVPENSFDRRYGGGDTCTSDIEFTEVPTNIIASSTSPFDKFPVDRRGERSGYYEYMGLRGLAGSSLGLSYMAKTIGSLVRAINENSNHGLTVVKVLDYLGYYGEIEARLILSPPASRIEGILNSHDPIKGLTEYLSARIPSRASRFLRMQNLQGSKELNDSVINAFRYYLQVLNKPRLDIVIDQHGAREKYSGYPLTEPFTVLLETGFLELRDISLHKKNVAEPFRMNDASSGEQCVLMALLGIASYIKDNSLICIDEPEICLHPEWQERYIELLMSIFSSFSGCHFIIATHSPQIVSRLGDHNCFVLDMHKGITTSAKDFNRRSADFQLASLFGAPGYKNEYLSRELIAALATISSGEKISSDRMTVLKNIISLQSSIEGSDPVYKLIEILKKALREVGL